jgi:hypothetical protein
MSHDRNAMPDFLGIGAPRSGTTWLHTHLAMHPDLWLPPRKELHYFDRSEQYTSSNMLACAHPWARLIGRTEGHREYRHVLWRTLLVNLHRPQWQRICWHARFLFGVYNDQWYASLFKQGRPRTTGEITPAYSLLEPADVQHIARIMPNVKIIYLLRNPIERAWSSYRKNGDAMRPIDELKQIIDHDAHLRSNYLRTLSIWRDVFPHHQILVDFYDQVIENPRGLLLRIHAFLSVEPSEKYVAPSAHRRINSSPSMEMPPQIRMHLTQKFYPQIKKLSATVDHDANRWLQEAESLLGT